MLSFRLPLWVYWTLAGCAVLGATVFTLRYDFRTIEEQTSLKLLFTVWGGPITLVLTAALVTWLKKRMPRR